MFILFTQIISAQTVIEQWNSELGSKERLEFSESIVHDNKYGSKEEIDSVENVLMHHAKVNYNRDVIACVYFVKSEFKATQSEYTLALDYLDSAQHYVDDFYILAKIFKRKGQYCSILNDLGNAYENFNYAVKTAEFLNDELLKSEIYIAIAEFKRKSGLFEEGLEYLEMALEIVEKVDANDKLLITIYDRYAAIYSQIGNFLLAKSNSHKALQKSVELGDKHSQAVSHNELGYIYEHEPNFDSSNYHYSKAIELWKSENAIRYLVNAQFNKSRLLLKASKRVEAKKLLHETEVLCKGKPWYDVFPRLFLHIAMAYQVEGDSVNYYKYLYKSTAAFGLSVENDNEKKIFELEHKYEQEKNIGIIDFQKNELALSMDNLELKKRQTTQLTIFLFVTTILLALAIYLLYTGIKKRKEIVIANENLEDALIAKEHLLKEVHHRVKNNFQMVSSLMSLQSRLTEDEKSKIAFEEAQTRIHAMALTHQKLYANDNYNFVNISDFLEGILSSLAHSDIRSQDIFEVSSSDLMMHIEQAIPLGTIIHELTTNSIKYAWPNHESKKIKLTFHKVNDEFFMEFRDNGIGLPEAFEIENSKSLGLKLIDLFIHRQLKGKIDFFNDQGAVFKFNFTLRNE